MTATASLFSNAKANASREDIACGLIFMVLQSIGSGSILSSLGSGIKDFVLIGNLTLLPQCREVYPAMEKLYRVRFRIPKYSEFLYGHRRGYRLYPQPSFIKLYIHES